MKLQVNQRVVDACLQLEGTEDALFEFADINEIGITESLAVGMELVGLPRHKGIREKSAVAALMRRPPGSQLRGKKDGIWEDWN